jgi:hypothetical protein
MTHVGTTRAGEKGAAVESGRRGGGGIRMGRSGGAGGWSWGGESGSGKHLYEMGIFIGPTKIRLYLGPPLWAEVASRALLTYRDGSALGTIDRA